MARKLASLFSPTKIFGIVLGTLCVSLACFCACNSAPEAGKIPLFGFAVRSDPDGSAVKNSMTTTGGRLVRERTYSDEFMPSLLSPPIRQPMITVEFDGGHLGPFIIDSSLWRIDNGHVRLCRVAIQHGATDSAGAFRGYDSLCDFISDSLGEPIWDDLNSSGDRFFRTRNFSFNDRAFFAGVAYRSYLSFPAEHSERKLLPGANTSTRLWQYHDAGGVWAITCSIMPNGRGQQSGETREDYSIRIEMIMKADLPKFYPDLSKRVESYSGWVSFGGDVLNDNIYLCDWVSDSAREYVRRYKLSLYPHIIITEDRWHVYAVSPGMHQIHYAYDTSNFAPANPDTLRDYYGHFFVRCKGVVFDTSETGLDLPALYITDVTEVRYSEEGDCP